MKNTIHVNEVKSFKRILMILKEYVEDFEGKMLKERTFPGCKLRPIEVWGNWLFCAVIRRFISGEFTFADGDEDGLIIDKRNGQILKTEHVTAINNPRSLKNPPKGEQRIIDAINKKIDMGPNYAKGKILIVFFDGAEKWYRNKVREAVNQRHHFQRIYLIGLMEKNNKIGYSYSVTELGIDSSITYKVQINPSFTNWSVSKINE